MNNFNDSFSQNMCLDWDSVIENDGQQFTILPEGDHVFTVVDFTRGRFPGSAKIQPCNKAELTLRVETPEGVVHVRTDLILFKSMEWKLSAFFRCIGQKKPGERLVMNWNKVVGSRGYAHFKPRTYMKDGKEYQVNDVDKFYDYDEKNFPENNWMKIPESYDDLPF
ncbi:MAG: hypothetical protein LUF78_09355 [Clostridiales bacterium]|nr:hypothetical protein [Clostridiales bacterium]